VDKLDKVGPATVRELLLAAGASSSQADACLALAEIRSGDATFVDRVGELGVEHPLLDEGLTELAAVVSTVAAAAPGRITADLKIARGLDYYTGTVYETQLVGFESWGSFCSGGRYDRLAADGRTTYPGVGISIGLTRMLGLFVGRGLLTASRSTPSCVLVAVSSEADRSRAVQVAGVLRSRGIACEVSPDAARFGRQIRHAERRGIPFVWFPGPAQSSETDSISDEVKDIRSGEQVAADPDSWMPPRDDLRPTVIRVAGSQSSR
jgi:histidyl-tRNA synthetase